MFYLIPVFTKFSFANHNLAHCSAFNLFHKANTTEAYNKDPMDGMFIRFLIHLLILTILFYAQIDNISLLTCL